MTPLDELFMAETMTVQVERFADQSRENSFIGVYEAGDRIMPITNEFVYDEVRYSRDLAPIAGPESPSKATKPLGLKKRAGQIYKISEHVDLPMTLLMMARGAGQLMPDPAGWLSKNLKNLTNKVQRTRNYWAAQSLLTKTGNVDLAAFPNSDVPGATVLSYPVATLNGTDWSAAGNSHRSQINTLKKTYKQNTGEKPGVAIASDTVETYLVESDDFSVPIDRSATLQQRKVENSFMENSPVNRIGGIDFRFAVDYYYADSAEDTPVAVISDPDLVAVLPPEFMWNEAFALAEGRQWIPSGAITSAAVGNPLALTSEVRGWGAYLELRKNPIGIRLHVFWAGNLVQKMQKGVLVYDTTP